MKTKIAIIGGGMSGLSTTYYLSQNPEYQIDLYEKNANFGGLLGLLTVNGVGFEGYYHHLFKSDKDIIGLIHELNIDHKLLYLPSSVGIHYNSKIYSFSTPKDLLHFSPLPLIDRIRLGFVAIYLQKFVTDKNWKKLAQLSAGNWILKYAGRRAYKIIWEPLLKGKFGEHADSISMAWLWSRLYLRSKSRNGANEELVYLDGGFKLLIDKLLEKLRNKQVNLYTNSDIVEIKPSGKQGLTLQIQKGQTLQYDKIIVTTPNPVFAKLCPSLPAEYTEKLAKVKYRGAMVAILQLKKQFMKDIYWLNVNDPNSHILAVVEHTNFVSPNKYSGAHLLYAGAYPAQTDELMTMNKTDLFELIVKELKKINPKFNKSFVDAHWIFRDKFAQPIVDTNYHNYIPPVKTGIDNLYLVNMAQVYPEDRGTNQAVRDGKSIADKIIFGEY